MHDERKMYALNFSRNASEARQKLVFFDESDNLIIRRTKAQSKVVAPNNSCDPGDEMFPQLLEIVQGVARHEVIARSFTLNIVC